MTIKGRHNQIPDDAPDETVATRRDLFAARAQAGNWVLAYVSPDRIDPNPHQPRKQIERAALEELKQSIASRGILQPLLGAKASHSRVQLVAGHRRLQAARELGLARVPVVLIDQPASEEDTVIDAVIENIQRRNLEAWEEGVAYAQLADEFGWTHDHIGRKIGKSRSYVSTRIRAAEKLSPLVKEVLATGQWERLGTSVPASEENHNSGEGDKAGPVPLNNVEIIRRLTTLSFEQQEALLTQIGQQLATQTRLSVKEVVELIKTGRPVQPSAASQLSFGDLGLDLFSQWPAAAPPAILSVEELDRLISLYERDLSKLRRARGL